MRVMKKSELIFSALLVPVDFLMLILAGIAAYFLRVSPLVAKWRPVLFAINLPFERYFFLTLAVAIFGILIFAVSGLYHISSQKRLFKEFFQIIVAASATILVVIIYIFFSRELFESRFIVLAAWILAIIFVNFGRFFMNRLQRFLIKKYRFGIHRLLVIGNDNIGEKIIKEVKREPALGYQLIANLIEPNIEEIVAKFNNPGIDEIILADPNWPKEKVIKLVSFCEEKHLVFKFVPNLFQTLTTNSQAETLGTIPLIEIKRTALDGWGKIIKRTFDIVFSLAFIIIFSPVYLVITLLIKLDSSGPVIYKDYRYGYRKKKFEFYKFRSMRTELCDGEFGTKEGNEILKKLEEDQEKNIRNGSPLHKIKDDPRITKVGKFIRRYSLDELPQFFNVLKGEMSLVGYRPHMSYEVDKYNYEQQKMFCSKPGITGLAQISGRSDLDFNEEVKLDLFYIENWSPKLDLIISLKTPFVVLFKKHKQ
jgi:lipopolysaccharide/colanic/teichoic acid biosynthesis glycosyltransferase